MTYINLINRLSACIIAGLFATQTALAVPITGVYSDDPTNCDNHGSITLTHELGPMTLGFPLDEGLFIDVQHTVTPDHFSCVGDDGIFNEYEVRMQNLSPFEWENVFFVADLGASPGNFDGHVDDITFVGVGAESFRIDAAGLNRPLVAESITADGILEVGELWSFVIDNWSLGAIAPAFGSIGKFADSSGIGLDTQSNASILATQVVPEPATIGLLIIGSLVASTLVRRQGSHS